MNVIAPPRLNEGPGTTVLSVPDTKIEITFTREAGTGKLLAIDTGGRRYVERQADGSLDFGGGFVRMREVSSARGMVRHVEAAGERWSETYRFDDEKPRLAHVDGVDMHYDAQDRIVACLPGGEDPAPSTHRWHYGYGRAGLTRIEGPFGARQISRTGDGRVLGWRQDGRAHRFSHDRAGRRRGVADPPARRFHRDEAGRLWAVTRPDGEISAVFLWDGYRCLARVDGAPGAPLGAVFCLDPSATPVRVIERLGIVRLPRDAFGEGLLARQGIPGLYGATIHRDLAHLRFRALDPACGVFCSPDPLDGGERDPRRGSDAAWKGPLPTEPDTVDAYTICRNDPVGRADPTGGVSAGVVISDFTWSFQNNLVTFFGVDWWFNLLLSLFTGFQLGNFGSSEGLVSSDHLGAFAVRRDGFVAWMTGGRAFTTQHIVWSNAQDFTDLEQGWVIDPQARFEPTQYGTLLHANPANDPPFLLRAARSEGGGVASAADWSRYGGKAEPAAPGSLAPVFPEGGFHLAGNPRAELGGQACPLSELLPGPAVAVGTLEQRATTSLAAGAARPAAGEPILLSDGDGDLLLTAVASSTIVNGGQGLLRFDDDAPAIGPANVTLMRLDPAPASSESLAAAPALANALSVAGTGNTYAAGDLLQATASGGEIGMARIDRPEARLNLDRALPGVFAGPVTLRQTTIAPAVATVPRVGADRLDFSAATTPAVGSFGLVEGSGAAIPVRVVDASDPASVQLDASLTPTGGPGSSVTFRVISPGGEIGRRDGSAEAGAVVTYRPNRPGGVPDGSSGNVILRFDSSGQEPAVRLVSGAPAYDAIVLDRALAGAGPWTVDRRVRLAGTTDIAGLTVTPAASLVATPASALDGALALRLTRVASAGDIPTPGPVRLAGVTMNGATATLSATPGTGTPFAGNPRPGQVVSIQQGGAGPLAVIGELRLTPTFDRTLNLEERDLSIVRMAEQGFTWTAERVAGDAIAVNPSAAASGGVADVDFPRFAAGECVVVRWDDGGAQVDYYRIGAVAGTRLTLEGPSAIGAGASNIRVRRILPDDPRTGGALLGRAGERVGGASTNQASFAVWSADAFPPNRVVGIVTGAVTRPAVIDGANQDLTISFGADTGLAGAADIHDLTVTGTGNFAAFVREDNAILITGNTAALTTGANQAIVVQPFVGGGSVAGSARLHAGSLRIPNEEDIEVDRRQALVDHELAHTVQYTKWGPLWFCYFPMMLLELPIEFATDAELPTYTAFAGGRVTQDGRLWRLLLTTAGSLSVSSGDTVQIVKGSQIADAEVERVETGIIFLKREGNLPTGMVQARKRNAHPAWDTVFSILQFFTHGGLMNGVVGTTWGGVIWLLAKGVYGIFKAIQGTGDLYPADVSGEGRILTLKTDAGRQAVNSNGQVIVRQGNVTVIRGASHAGGVLTLDQAIAQTGEVNVARYSDHEPGSAFNWLDYHAANVVDAANRFVIDVTGHGDAFGLRDRVEVSYRDQSFRSNVMAKTGDRLQLEHPVPVVGSELSLRIAKVGDSDPMGNADTHLITEMGLGWMRYIFDPWGQLDLRIDTSETWANILLRVVRYVLGTQNFSMLPFLGYVFYGRFFIAEHLAKIEQDASEKSGDLYTPLSRLFGQARKRDGAYGTYDMVVGDIARFRYWNWGNRLTVNDLNRTLQGAPGVHANAGNLRLLPYRATTAAAAAPNDTTEVDAAQADPARALPDRFTVKNAADPTALDGTTANPTSILFGDLGLVPESPTNMRHLTGYVAFCRGGEHRVTVGNGILSSAETQELQERERQTIYFDITARDVVVRIGGQTIADGATIAFVHTQQAVVEVSVADGAPGGARTFRATLRRPGDSPILRRSNALRLQAQASDGNEPVEISRFYPYDAAGGTYSDASLQKFGAHLAGDIDIAVRHFTIAVSDLLALRATADPAAAGAAALAQDTDGFLLVPAAIRRPPEVTQFGGRAMQASDPAVTIESVASPSAEVRAFVGADGAAFRVRFAPTPAPALAGPVAIVIETGVGIDGGLQSVLRTEFSLQ